MKTGKQPHKYNKENNDAKDMNGDLVRNIREYSRTENNSPLTYRDQEPGKELFYD